MKRKLEYRTDAIVYVIRNCINDKKYIGSTLAKGNIRKNKHYNDLRKNKHHCKHLQSAWNKYKAENFVFEILEKVNVGYVEELLEREQKWMDSFKPEYNTLEKAGSAFGFKMPQSAKDKISKAQLNRPKSEQTKQKLREINTGKIVSDETKKILFKKNVARCIGISQYNLDGELIKIWQSLSQLQKNKFSSNKIKRCCLGMIKSHKHKGYIWKFSNEESKEKASFVKLDLKNKKCKKISQYDFNCNLIRKWNSISHAASECKFSQPKISSCCTGKKLFYNGCIWIYSDENKNEKDKVFIISCKIKNLVHHHASKVSQFDKTGTLVKIWNSISETKKEGFMPNSISSCCRKRYGFPSHRGFIWRYYNEIKYISNKELMINLFPIKEKKIHKRNRRRVKQIDINGSVVKIWDSIKDAKRNGFSDSSITHCCHKKRKFHFGFQWEYAE